MWSPGGEADELIVDCIGGFVADGLGRAHEGRVRAVFERSAYVELDGRWICIGDAGIRRGPINAQVGAPGAVRRWLPTLRQDSRVHGEWPTFRAGPVRLDFAHATRWRPSLPALPVDRPRVVQGLARMRGASRGRIPAEGLGFLVADAFARDADDALAGAGLAAATGLRAWLASGKAAKTAPPEALRGLIGLGPGLTPSGDDFLGGALVALHAFGRRDVAHALGEWLLPACASATHPVSLAHLGAAAAGEGGEALHACLCTIADGEAAHEALDAVASVGHTSGWDALAGAVTVASAICSTSS